MVLATYQMLGVHAVALQQREQLVSDRVGPDGARAADGRAELGEHQRGAAGGAGSGDPDLVDQLAVLSFGDRLDVAYERVEHVCAEGDDGGGSGHDFSWDEGRVVP